MIRYPVTQAQMEADVDAARPTWRQRAHERTEAFRTAGKYEEPPAPIWSEIKTVFMRLQYDKCAYRERQLAAAGRGLIEHDVEHFRPKNAVRAWPQTNREVPFAYSFPTGGDFPEGYYLLAYNLLNYATACKPCNSSLKSNYFPITGSRISGQDNPRNLETEQPLLIYPLGDLDEDPAELIRFDGHIPVPVSQDITSYAFQRARVTIDFFKLAISEELLRERLRLMGVLWMALHGAATASTKVKRAEFEDYVNIHCSQEHPHYNFADCYKQLFVTDQAKAKELAEAARKLFLSATHNVSGLP